MVAAAGVVAGAEGAVGADPVDSGAEEGPVEGGASGEAVARPGAGEDSEEVEASGVGVGASVGAGAGAERGYLSSRRGMGECKGFKFCVRTAPSSWLFLCVFAAFQFVYIYFQLLSLISNWYSFWDAWYTQNPLRLSRGQASESPLSLYSPFRDLSCSGGDAGPRPPQGAAVRP